MLMCCISSKSTGLKAAPIFTCSTLNTALTFKHSITKTNIWVPITLFRIIFKFANAVVNDGHILHKAYRHVSNSGFVISYVAILTFQLPAKSQRGACDLPRKVSGEFITFSWGPHSPTSAHVACIFLWQAHHTSPNSLKLSDCLLATKMRLSCHSCNWNKKLATVNIKQPTLARVITATFCYTRLKRLQHWNLGRVTANENSSRHLRVMMKKLSCDQELC